MLTSKMKTKCKTGIILLICVASFLMILSLSQKHGPNMALEDIIQWSMKIFNKHEEAKMNNLNGSNATLYDIPMNFNVSLRSKPPTLKIVWPNAPEWIVRRNKAKYMETCEYSNCYTSEKQHDIETAAALVFVPTHQGLGSKPPIPPEKRNSNQIWVFYTLEPPMNFYFPDFRSKYWLNTMNWSMTYKLDSDIVAPYGTLMSRQDLPHKNYGEIYDKKTKTAVALVSHCNAESQRDIYNARLNDNGVSVDTYGSCGKAGHFDGDISGLLAQYKFYLSFENSLCKDYLTEKVFSYYNMDIILVVRGGAHYSQLLPKDTYINTADFHNVTHLSGFLKNISSDRLLYTEFLRRKDRYIAYDEDTFGYPFAMCELCRKLNNVSEYRHIYGNMQDFFDRSQCTAPKDLEV